MFSIIYPVMSSINDITELLDESLKMKLFSHPNILNLIGVCVDAGPAPYVIMPYMANGSLLHYLRKERPQLTIAEGAEPELVSLSPRPSSNPVPCPILRLLGWSGLTRPVYNNAIFHMHKYPLAAIMASSIPTALYMGEPGNEATTHTVHRTDIIIHKGLWLAPNMHGRSVLRL